MLQLGVEITRSDFDLELYARWILQLDPGSLFAENEVPVRTVRSGIHKQEGDVMARITFLRDRELSALVNLCDSIAEHVEGKLPSLDIDLILKAGRQTLREQEIVNFLNRHYDVDFRIWRLKDPGGKR